MHYGCDGSCFVTSVMHYYRCDGTYFVMSVMHYGRDGYYFVTSVMYLCITNVRDLVLSRP